MKGRRLSEDEITNFQNSAVVLSQGSDEDIRQIFFGEGEVELTDSLIDELVIKEGCDREDLKEFQSMGCKYNKIRGTVISPFMTD
jgi:hypothetical protein